MATTEPVTPYEPFKTLQAIKIGFVTLVGVYPEVYPVSHGNCFDLCVPDEEAKFPADIPDLDGVRMYRILNFTYENFKELLRREVIEYPVTIVPLDNTRAALHDTRIPLNWYAESFCRVCTPWELLTLPQQLRHDHKVQRGVVTYGPRGTRSEQLNDELSHVQFKPETPVDSPCPGCNTMTVVETPRDMNGGARRRCTKCNKWWDDPCY